MKQACIGCNLLFLGPFLDDNLLCRKCKLKPANIDKISDSNVRQLANLERTIYELKCENNIIKGKLKKSDTSNKRLKYKISRLNGKSVIDTHRLEQLEQLEQNTNKQSDSADIMQELLLEIEMLYGVVSDLMPKKSPKKKRKNFSTKYKPYNDLTKEQKSLYCRIRSRHIDKNYQGDLISVKDYVDYMLNTDFKCVYCPKDATGFDRIDSKITYAKDNIQPCCVTCNRMKWTMSEEQFKEHLNLIRGK